MSIQGGHMNYVTCHACGDPVAGRIPSGNEPRKLQCAHCHHAFEFVDAEVRSGIVVYDDIDDRWKVRTIMDDLQTGR
jgi:transcription elongation factor Elf1